MAGPTAEVASLAGRTLGHYRILDKIGEGGMGEVYRAHDEHLDCDVAIKVLPPGSVGDESARKQFQKEARALARLNHPNIAIVHHFDTQQGVDYLVMEFIPGITLSQKLAQGRLPEREVIRLALQLAEGLSAAHEHGVIHSDVKPSNLRLSSDGRLKILDFGVAKLRLPVTESATTQSLSDKQILGGTLPYMAPEQLLAGEVDARTDIHAAGCVLYEMATGQRPFADVEPSQLIGAILSRRPLSPAAINPALSAELERIVAKCLEKEPENRYQSARELAIDLRRLQTNSSGLPATCVLRESSRSQTALLQVVKVGLAGVALVITVVFVAFWLNTQSSPLAKILSATQITNDGRDKFVAFRAGGGPTFPLLTDGVRVYFEESRGRAFIVQVSAAGGETALITREYPSPWLMDVSPAGSELLVGGNREEPEPRIEVLPLPAGSRRRLGDLRGHDGAWSPDGQEIVYAAGNDVYRARRDGTDPQKILSTAGSPFWLRWSPDGGRIRFSLRDTNTGASSLWEVGRDGSGVRALLPGWNSPSDECCGNWSPDGRFFVFQSTKMGRTNIWALLEEKKFWGKGSAIPLPLTGGGMNYFAPVVSRDGKQIFVKGAIPRGELVLHDANTRQFVPYLAGISADGLDFSRDGRWVTYTAYPEGTLWRSRVDGKARDQLTFSPMQAFLPRWSPDGRKIAFAAKVPGSCWKIYVISADGGRPEQMTDGPNDEGDVGWSADGTTLVYGLLYGPTAIRSIHLLDLNTRRTSTLPGSDGLYAPRWSPDGRYVAAIPVTGDKLLLYDLKAKQWSELLVSYPTYPNWSRNGTYIYFDSMAPSGPAFVRVRISDGKIEKMADLKDVRHANSEFGPWSGLTPGDSSLLLRDTGSQEIYALDWEAR